MSHTRKKRLTIELNAQERVTLLFALWSAAERAQARAGLLPQWAEFAHKEAEDTLRLLERVERCLYAERSTFIQARTREG